MNPGPELLARQRELRPWFGRRYHISEAAYESQQRELRQRRARRHPVLDRLVAAALILADLLAATATTYLGNLLLIVVANVLLILGLSWLWRQYREHTAPSQFDRPRFAAKPDIPLLVRLLLLPGVSRWAGSTLISKARAIRFMRTDMHRQAMAARRAHAGGPEPSRMSLDIPPCTSWERSMHNWAERHPDECSNTVHLFESGSHRCRCDSWYWSSLNDVRTIA